MKILDVLKKEKVVKAIKGTAMVTGIVSGLVGIISTIAGVDKIEREEELEKAVEKYMSEKEKLEE